MEGRAIWEYFEEFHECEEIIDADNNEKQPSLSGAHASLHFENDNTNTPRFAIHTRMKSKKKFVLGEELEEFLVQKVMFNLPMTTKRLKIWTEHHRHGEVFRGSPYYRGAPWRDWVMVDWGGLNTAGVQDGEEVEETDGRAAARDNSVNQLPCQIWCFIDLRDIDECEISPAIYAVVETALPRRNKQEVELCDLFVPYLKEMGNKREDGTYQRCYRIVDVDCIADTACLIPDLGSTNSTAFLRLLPRTLWAEQFELWIHQPHERDFEPHNP
jgi:hypothetical protein